MRRELDIAIDAFQELYSYINDHYGSDSRLLAKTTFLMHTLEKVVSARYKELAKKEENK